MFARSVVVWDFELLELNMNNTYLLRLVLISLLATVISLGISVAIGKLPLPMDAKIDGVASVDKDKIYSLDELRKSDQAMSEKIRKLDDKANHEDFFSVGRSIINRSSWMSWIPWFLVPFIFQLRKYYSVFILLLFPLLLVTIGILPLREVAIYFVATNIGFFLNKQYEERPKTS